MPRSTFASPPISDQQPAQKSRPQAGLPPAISSARRKPSKLLKMRATPPMAGPGGSSGCSASRTPASSATGSTAVMKYS